MAAVATIMIRISLCVIADNHTGWAIKVTAKMGIRRVAFCPISATVFSWMIGIPMLIGDMELSMLMVSSVFVHFVTCLVLNVNVLHKHIYI